MGNISAPLRKRALHAYQQVLAEKLRDARLCEQLTLRDAFQLKLWKLFGGDCLVDFEGDEDERVLGATVEGLKFLGIRCSNGDVKLILVELCPRCGHNMTSQSLTSLIALGGELFQLEMGGTLSNHECA